MPYLLTINGGSSSIKFALFDAALSRVLSGQFSRIGLEDAVLEIKHHATNKTEKRNVSAAHHAACIPILIELISETASWEDIQAIGHRIVHGGGRFSEPELVTPEMLAELETIAPYAPEHLPAEIAMLRAFAAQDGNLKQIACFDTAFHQTMPRVAHLLPLPRRFFEQGVRRYGFHGLSYQYLMGELEKENAAKGKIILAHLGNGASMAAVLDGKSIDTSMAFTPTAGLVMSTRSGDLDPGLVVYLARTVKMTAAEFQKMVNAESGLLGISETSSDMRDLMSREQEDERAADAIAVFCRQAKKFIGAYAAILGGLDTLVFAGGIGENSSVLRARICEDLQFLGIELDPAWNDSAAPIISTNTSRVTVRVIKTDEEIQMARLVKSKLEK